ncbi:MAG: hypothetical protein HWN68_02915 [Desulfobacterales bacterium]|nr:hypothetical protein [Desulfobacterales bacterium]
MLQRKQELVDQFNRDEKRWRRIKLPKLGALSHALLDIRDEMRERRRSADCVSREWIGGCQ